MVTQLTHLEFGMVVELSYNGSMKSLDGLEGEFIEDFQKLCSSNFTSPLLTIELFS